MDGSAYKKSDKRRRRPALACVTCRKSKIRCDRNMPCGACVRSKHKTCVYEPAPTKVSPSGAAAAATAAASVPVPPREVGSGGLSRFPISPSASSQAPSVIDVTTNSGSHDEHVGATRRRSLGTVQTVAAFNRPLEDPPVAAATSHDVDSLLLRVKELEQQLQSARITPQANSQFDAPSKPDVAEPLVTLPTYLSDDIHTMSRSVMSKTRYFGQSHWMNIVSFLKPVMNIFENQPIENKSEIIMQLHQNKMLGRTIKAQRMPELTFNFGLTVPPRDVADRLVDGYLRTFESVYRILHVPSFRAEYEKYWTSPRDTVNQAFVIQLQLVMAAGAGVYDDTHSMRKDAIGWVYEAKCWLITPPLKSKLTVTGIQNMLLLHFAREVAGVSGDLTWISSGSVIRSALAMGLHRDPKRLPKMSRLDAEVRRRLWSTILELALQSSLNAGGPPMISLDEFDTGPPSDYDDSDLEGGDETQSQPPIANANRYTDMSVALAFRKSFPIRLAIVRHLNDLNSQAKYDDTLKLNAQLQTAYKAVALSLRRLDDGSTTATMKGGRHPSRFQKELVNFIFHHYFQALHLPYLSRAFREPAYAFSRKITIEMSLKLFSAVSESPSYGYSVVNNSSGPTQGPSPALSAGSSSTTTTHDDIDNNRNDLRRLAINSSGFFRNVTSKASMLIPLELQYLALENDGLGLVTPRPDLLAACRDTPAWALRRIRSGETNVKGFILCRSIICYVEGLAAGVEARDLYAPCIEAARAGAREAGDVLRELAGQQPGGGDGNTSGGGSTATMLNQQGTMLSGGGEFNVEGMEIDWDLDMSNALFEFTSIDAGFATPGEPDLGLFNYGFNNTAA
ncbi:presequence translocated-associated motor subunit PAM17- mitochondrial [Apiospora arundinis]